MNETLIKISILPLTFESTPWCNL